MSSLRSVLLIDADCPERETVAAEIRHKIGCVVFETGSVTDALALLDKQDVCLVIFDAASLHCDGLSLMHKIRGLNPETAVVMAISKEQESLAVEALRQGAFFHIKKPYNQDEAVIITARALERHDYSVHDERRSPKVRKSDGFQGIVGDAPNMQRLYRMIERIADDESSTVLIQGESGTGKELVARAIHTLSSRHAKNFVPVNCAAIPSELLESELFGYVKGAFTGANQAKIGRFEYADGGILFLDEIGDMQPALQSKLLRVLQEREFEPVGSVKSVAVDVRVVAATHRNLEQAVAAGEFREDLYYRLSVVPVDLPPLRERAGDVQVLISKFVTVFNRGRKVPSPGFSDEAVAVLAGYPWPGNVRELENLVQRMIIMNGGARVEVADLPKKYVCVTPGSAEAQEPSLELETVLDARQWDFNTVVAEFEGRLINEALRRTEGNKKEAAQLLNLKRTTLTEKLKKRNLL
ncbi:MAG: sigma-54 dependent transcriptional regulator [Desulfuromonadales bacterium]|nr:sigma-54 dependent transcriptional regulator [Desulfuromonadales bacterium]